MISLRLAAGAVLAAALSATAALAGPLHDAARAGDLALVEKLIAEGVPVDDRDESGETPLMAAALAGNTEIVKDLIVRFRADAKARNDRGMAPLHAAAMSGDLISVEYMLYGGGADLDDADNKFGVTPAIIAAEENNASLLSYLISYGADIELTERHGYSALTRAAYKGNDAVITILLRAGATCQTIDPAWLEDCIKRKTAMGL